MTSHGIPQTIAAFNGPSCPFFRLSDGCRPVAGACNAAIYDLASSQVYGIDASGRKILEACCESVPVDRVSEMCSGAVGQDEVTFFLRELEFLGLGTFSHDPYTQPPPVLVREAPRLTKLWLEVTTRCNQRCVHCYAGAPMSYHSAEGSLSLAQWKRVVTEAVMLETPWMQITGGEPLLMGKPFIRELLFHGRAAGVGRMELFTNGSLIDEDWGEIFKETGTDVAFSIYSRSAGIHDRITGVRGSHERLLRNIELLMRRGVAVRPGFVVMKENKPEERETTAWLSSRFGDSPKSFDIIRCTPDGRCDGGLHISPELWRRKLRTDALFSPVSESDFNHRMHSHPCLSGSLCVHHTGDVFPCIMDRVRKLGSVAERSLPDIISSNAVKSVWNQTLSSVNICRDCEFRFACMDCRPEAAGIYTFLYPEAGKPFDQKNPCCMYDPYSGAWLDADPLLSQLAGKVRHAAGSSSAFFTE